MRLREMMRIRRRAVADNFPQNFRIPFLRRIQRLQREHRRAFAEREAIAIRIERPANRRRQRLQRIEPAKNHLADAIVTAGEHALRLSAPDQIPRMADRIRARSARIRDDRDRPAEPERIHHIQRLPLRLVILHARGLPAVAAGRVIACR